MPDSISILTFKNDVEWEQWLRDNYTNEVGIWIQIAKKNSGIESVTYLEALDVALCYGWIDGQRKAFDAMYFLQKFTPRRSRSLWSKVNIDKVKSLIASNRMQASGFREIERAQSDGRWDAAYESQSKATIPSDLLDFFEKNPKAKIFYESLNKTNQYAILWRLMTAKTTKTRTSRLEKITKYLKAEEKLD